MLILKRIFHLYVASKHGSSTVKKLEMLTATGENKMLMKAIESGKSNNGSNSSGGRYKADNKRQKRSASRRAFTPYGFGNNLASIAMAAPFFQSMAGNMFGGNPGGSSSNSGVVQCRYCKSYGHYMSDCPKKAQQGQAQNK